MEVLHEKSFPFIKAAISHDFFESYMVRRLNFFGDLNHHLRLDLAQEDKPCSDGVIRLAKARYPVYGDGESLRVDPAKHCDDYVNKIVIYHYGMAREDKSFLKKSMSMQSWFFGEGSQVDHRIKEMVAKGEVFDWEVMKTREMLTECADHPVFAKEWVNVRQPNKPKKV